MIGLDFKSGEIGIGQFESASDFAYEIFGHRESHPPSGPGGRKIE